MPAQLPRMSIALPALILVALLAVLSQRSPAAAESDARDRVTTALLRVSKSAPVVLEEGYQAPSEADVASFRNTMAQLVTSRLVLEAALRRQEVAEIPAIQAAEDDVAWLRERLQVDYPGGGEIMRIRLADGSLSDDELKKILTSVVETFLRDVVDRERIDQLRAKEILQLQLERATNELMTRRTEYFSLTEEFGGLDSPMGNLRTEMVLEKWRANRAERRELHQSLADAYLEFQLSLVNLGALALPDESTEPERGAREEDADKQDADAAPELPAEERDDAGPARQDGLVEVTELDAQTQEHVDRARARYEVISNVRRAQIASLDQEAEVMTEHLEKLLGQNAEIEQRREDLERRAELVDQMAKKLAAWDLQLAARSSIKPIQDAQIETRNGKSQP